MGWPQLVWIVLAGIGLGIALTEHGKPKTGKHNAWTQIIGIGIAAFLLNAGGFFNGGA